MITAFLGTVDALTHCMLFLLNCSKMHTHLSKSVDVGSGPARTAATRSDHALGSLTLFVCAFILSVPSGGCKYTLCHFSRIVPAQDGWGSCSG